MVEIYDFIPPENALMDNVVNEPVFSYRFMDLSGKEYSFNHIDISKEDYNRYFDKVKKHSKEIILNLLESNYTEHFKSITGKGATMLTNLFWQRDDTVQVQDKDNQQIPWGEFALYTSVVVSDETIKKISNEISKEALEEIHKIINHVFPEREELHKYIRNKLSIPSNEINHVIKQIDLHRDEGKKAPRVFFFYGKYSTLNIVFFDTYHELLKNKRSK